MVLPALLLAATSGGSTGLAVSLYLVAVALAILEIVALWRLFTKAGERGWKSLIPIYNSFILLRIIGRPWYWLLLLAIPIIDIVFVFIVYYDLSKAYGHGIPYWLGLLLLPGVMIPVLAFGRSRYYGPGGVLTTVSPRVLERSGAPGWGGTGSSSPAYDGNWAKSGAAPDYDDGWNRRAGYDWGGPGGSASAPAAYGGYQQGSAYGSASQGGQSPASGYSPAVSAAQAASTSPPSWHPDPRGRHELRYWDGNEWTEHVADAGAQGTDPV
jgi:hypothetical protein